MASVPQGHVSNQLGRTHGVARILVFFGLTLFCAGGLLFMFVVVYAQLNPDFDILTWLPVSGASILSGLVLTAVGSAIEAGRRGA